MMKSRFPDSQIKQLLDSVKTPSEIKALCAEHKISRGTYYTWRRKFNPQVSGSSPVAQKQSVPSTDSPAPKPDQSESNTSPSAESVA